MADPQSRKAGDSSVEIPLIDESQAADDAQLEKFLRRLELFLGLFGFSRNSALTSILAWLAFTAVGVVVPVLIIGVWYCSNCSRYQIRTFELQILISQVVVAAISLLCISRNLSKYGLQKLLFMDHYGSHIIHSRNEYTQKIRVSSIVELVGLFLCLHGAAKISHRAQGVASVASRWHALVSSNSNDGFQMGTSTNGGNLESAYPTCSLSINYSESDLDSMDYVPRPTNTQLASYMSSYQKRQAFVTYLQSNHGGFTVFGWTIDRVLINTIFFVELSLVFFVLGKTITITTK